jgi:hypothetical protein
VRGVASLFRQRLRLGRTIALLHFVVGKNMFGKNCRSTTLITSFLTQILLKYRSFRSASVGNLILLHTWCPTCCAANRRLKDDELIFTADYFKGKYLGSTKYNGIQKFNWQCEFGHRFTRSPNNIRRREGTKRKCSWCPVCTKQGMRFVWNVEAKNV